MTFDKDKILNELLKPIDPKLILRDVRITADLDGTHLSIFILAGFGKTATENKKIVDLNNPTSLTVLSDWLEETILEIHYR